MVNNFDKMKSVQTTLDNLSAGAPETIETSGTVTAVTPEEEDGTGDTSDASAEEGSVQEDQNAEAQPDEQEEPEEDSSSDATAEASDSAFQSSGENGSNGVYVVEKGDTLAIISRKMYGDITHVDAICRMNGIEDGDLIYVGQKLLLP